MRLIRRLTHGNHRLSRRLERRRLQLRAWAKRGELEPLIDRTREMPPGPIAITTLRNEAVRLPWFLAHYRRLGIAHFLVVDNGSTDGSAEHLAAEPDTSVWRTGASYRQAQFGVDWINHLLARHGAGRWILCVDPDELLVYPHHTTRRLPALIRWLEATGRESFGTLLLDMYGPGPIETTAYRAGEDPLAAAPFFDAGNYVAERHGRYHNLWLQGGPRMRAFFADQPARAPALNKIPLVKWRPGTVFVTSTHNLLPRRLNLVYSRSFGTLTSGVLLHMKFLDCLAGKVTEELTRREHYDGGAEYDAYAAGQGTRLWTPQSTRYEGWEQLVRLGLMAKGGWF
ncbi:MAG: glycosyltransferase family 2 protein [Pseudomonadota bacterium]